MLKKGLFLLLASRVTGVTGHARKEHGESIAINFELCSMSQGRRQLRPTDQWSFLKARLQAWSWVLVLTPVVTLLSRWSRDGSDPV